MDQKTNKQEDYSDILPLAPQEVQLIRLMRNRFRYEDIVIKMRNGLPYRILKAWISEDL